jgi:hypothetical protein
MALLKVLINPEASRMITVEPTKNHGRFLNVSQPKRMADPVENSMPHLIAFRRAERG